MWPDFSEMSTEQLESIANLTEARILKIEKDALCMDEQQLLWSPELEKEVVGYWSTLNGYWSAKKVPKCTCGDYENGFLARPDYNPYYYKGEPCNLELLIKFKKSQTSQEKETANV